MVSQSLQSQLLLATIKEELLLTLWNKILNLVVGGYFNILIDCF